MNHLILSRTKEQRRPVSWLWCNDHILQDHMMHTGPKRLFAMFNHSKRSGCETVKKASLCHTIKWLSVWSNFDKIVLKICILFYARLLDIMYDITFPGAFDWTLSTHNYPPCTYIFFLILSFFLLSFFYILNVLFAELWNALVCCTNKLASPLKYL